MTLTHVLRPLADVEQHTLLLLEGCESPGWSSGLCGRDCSGILCSDCEGEMPGVHT